MRRKPPVLIFAHALKDVPCAASETKAAARSFSGVNIDASSSLVFIDDMLWPCVARIESGDDDAGVAAVAAVEMVVARDVAAGAVEAREPTSPTGTPPNSACACRNG